MLKAEHDAVASNLHALIPEAVPEIIPVAMPGGDRLVLVLRVDADAVPHPVMVSGKVLTRIPGHSVPADRRRVLDLMARDQAARDAERGRMNVPSIPWHPTEIGLWPEHEDPQLRTGALRVTAGWNSPGGYSTSHGWTRQRARQPSTRSTTAPSGRVPNGR